MRQDNEIREPLLLRKESFIPPRGQGNAKTLNDDVVREFAESTVKYMRDVERTCGVAIRRIAIDAPSDPKIDGLPRREAEKGLDKRGISCITTPTLTGSPQSELRPKHIS